ncbi:MAG TPA: hypothetical protein VN371_00145 [Chlorobaculum sp.]|nr:hypothetical protein [Chlorobaculum sp.]
MGSEENYVWLVSRQIQGYVKSDYVHNEQRKASRNEPVLLDPNALHYDDQDDRYICPWVRP